MLDLGPAAWQMAALIGSTPDAMLSAPTPCPAYSLGDLIDHVGGLATAFRMAAAKEGDGDQQASGDASRLPLDWHTSIPRAVNLLAESWRDPDAWTGMARAGGVDMPGEVTGVVALDELVIHGWDIAQALGRPYNSDPTTLGAVLGFVQQFGDDDRGEGALFGPAVAVGDDAPLLHRVVALAGRDPSWRVDLR